MQPHLTIRPGHPDFLDLPWDQALPTWTTDRMVDLPRGISRHEVRFVTYAEGVYAVKELPRRPARNDFQVLRQLEDTSAPAVMAVGLVEDRSEDPHEERSAALITRYERFSFSYRELLSGAGFGERRSQLLDAFAGLLVKLHRAGCFWGDCSLSNVLYRFDADGIETIMVDAETARVHDQLTNGQREEDLAIMIENVAGGMADIAAQASADVDRADLALGRDIAVRYQALWEELTTHLVIASDARFRIRQRIERLNELGWNVDEVDLQPTESGFEFDVSVKVGNPNFHSDRLLQLTGVQALERQASYLLSDLYHFQAGLQARPPVAAALWRTTEFEPAIDRLKVLDPQGDPIQMYTDVLNHRFRLASEAGHDIDTADALADWEASGRPGFLLSQT